MIVKRFSTCCFRCVNWILAAPWPLARPASSAFMCWRPGSDGKTQERRQPWGDTRLCFLFFSSPRSISFPTATPPIPSANTAELIRAVRTKRINSLRGAWQKRRTYSFFWRGGFPELTESDLSLHGIWAVCTIKGRHAPLGFPGAPPCIFNVQMKHFPKMVINAETSRWGCTTVSFKSHTKGSGRTLVLLCVYFCSTTTEQPLNPLSFS